MDKSKKSGFNCSGICFVSVLKLLQSSCSILIQPSALSMSEWFPPAHWAQHLPHEVGSLRHPPSGFFSCVPCYVFLSRNCLGAGVDDIFLGDLPWHLRWSQAFMMSYVSRGARNNPDFLLISAVRPRHLHQMGKDLFEPFKSFLHPSLSSLRESNTYLGEIVEKKMQISMQTTWIKEGNQVPHPVPAQRWAEVIQFRFYI